MRIYVFVERKYASLCTLDIVSLQNVSPIQLMRYMVGKISTLTLEKVPPTLQSTPSSLCGSRQPPSVQIPQKMPPIKGRGGGGFKGRK